MIDQRRSVKLAAMAVGVAIAVLLIAGVEGGLYWLLTHPEALRSLEDTSWLKRVMREYYVTRDMRVIQYEDGCAEYHPAVFYVLKPGVCRFRNREFDTTFQVSSEGRRVGVYEERPAEVLVVGDSNAMGWGVGEGKTFAEILERRLNLGVRNVAMASYGTPREMMALERYLTDSVRGIIIAYCENDYFENVDFMMHGALVIGSKEFYDDVKKDYRRRIDPHLFALTTYFLTQAVGKKTLSSAPDRDYALEAKMFIDVLGRYDHLFTDRDVVVMEINGRNQNSQKFGKWVSRLFQSSNLQGKVRAFTVVDVSQYLTTDDYYVLDQHLNESGQTRVADVLQRQLTSGGTWLGRSDRARRHPGSSHP